MRKAIALEKSLLKLDPGNSRAADPGDHPPRACHAPGGAWEEGKALGQLKSAADELDR